MLTQQPNQSQIVPKILSKRAIEKIMNSNFPIQLTYNDIQRKKPSMWFLSLMTGYIIKDEVHTSSVCLDLGSSLEFTDKVEYFLLYYTNHNLIPPTATHNFFKYIRDHIQYLDEGRPVILDNPTLLEDIKFKDYSARLTELSKTAPKSVYLSYVDDLVSIVNKIAQVWSNKYCSLDIPPTPTVVATHKFS